GGPRESGPRSSGPASSLGDLTSARSPSHRQGTTMEISSEHKARIQEAKEQVLARIEEAEDEDALERARVVGLGKSGLGSELRRTSGSRAPEMRKPFGEAVNAASAAVEGARARRAQQLAEARLGAERGGPRLDLALPGRARPLGRRHPI